MTDMRLLDLPCLPESAAGTALVAQLPATTPPPPWHCRVRAVVWLQRGAPPVDGEFAGRLAPVTMAAVVDYLDSPVGPYREVFAGAFVRGRGRPALHVPFIAVDSVPSVHGGRAHWRLPKVLARFDGDVGTGDVTATGEGWSVQVASSVSPVPVPLVATLAGAQDDRRSRLVLRGRGRAARVRVTATGPTLGGWLGTGTHAGVVGTGRMVVHPALAKD